MKKVIYLEASPRKSRSHSKKIAAAYLEKIQANASELEIKTIDLWDYELPEFNGPMMDAKYAVIAGENPSDEQKNAWTETLDSWNFFSFE